MSVRSVLETFDAEKRRLSAIVVVDQTVSLAVVEEGSNNDSSSEENQSVDLRDVTCE